MPAANNNEKEIRKLIEDNIKATCSKDINGLMSCYSPDVVQFDVVDPLEYFGSDSIRERMDQWFSTFAGPIEFETKDLSVTATDDIGFSHGLNHVSAMTTKGTKLDMWWRSTTGYKKENGKWVITHQHNSVPFNTETSKASLDLKP